MNEYMVRWEIDILADTPEDAARQALAIQRDPCSVAVVFYVRGEDGRQTAIDLLECGS